MNVFSFPSQSYFNFDLDNSAGTFDREVKATKFIKNHPGCNSTFLPAKYYFTENGLLNLFLLDGNASLLENMAAINLLRKYGRNDAVYFYNKGIEVDFYVPDASTAIQVCFDLDNSAGLFEKEKLFYYF